MLFKIVNNSRKNFIFMNTKLAYKINVLFCFSSDSRIQDRSLAPHDLKDQLSRVGSEVSGIADKLQRYQIHRQFFFTIFLQNARAFSNKRKLCFCEIV